MDRLTFLPIVGDAVVVDEVKYRIVVATSELVQLAIAGPFWRRTEVTRRADPRRLEWDRLAGVWRGPSEPSPATVVPLAELPAE